MVSADESKSLNILLVDDDAELCEMMREFFEQNGHALDCVRNGIDGLERAVEHRFDLVILDVMLPGMNGFTLLSQLRRRREVPVIMLTARTDSHDRVQGLEAGADDYLPKPFDPSLDVHMSHVRKKLEPIGRQIQTIRGVGYLFTSNRRQIP